MNQTRKHLLARALATLMAGGLLLVGYASGAALFEPAPSEPPLPTSLADAPETGTAGFVLQGRDGSLVPLSPATGVGNSIASSYYDKRPTETETISLTDQILAGVDAPLVVRARSRYPSPAAAPSDSTPLSGMVPTLALIGLGLWFALYFARSSHTFHGHQPSDTSRGFFKPGRKSH
jgi:hypothetical protein